MLCCLVLLFPLGLPGCTSAPSPLSAIRPAAIQGVDEKAWDEGMRAFEQGDYRKAAGLFQILSENGDTDEVGRMALFALAASRFAMAQTPEEYSDAVASWEKWSSRARPGLTREDPRMLAPFLFSCTPAALTPEKSEPSMAQPKKTPREAPVGINYKNMLQSKEKEVDNLRMKLDSREREVRRLRHQLESLEEIHRKYQEKKQEASTP
ncbi:MAG: hypothetical protein ABFD97_16305 [Syntrophobacter sp.]